MNVNVRVLAKVGERTVWVEGEGDVADCGGYRCSGEGDVGKYLLVGPSYSAWGGAYAESDITIVHKFVGMVETVEQMRLIV